MPYYTYRVRDKAGRTLQGEVEASDDRDLRKKLDEKGYFIIDFAVKKSGLSFLSMSIPFLSGGVGLKDLALISWQLYTMLNASLTLVSSLKIISKQAKNPTLASVISRVCQRVEEGSSFSQALAEFPRVFPRLMVQMVNAGEVGGVLDEMLRRVAVYYESQAHIRSRIRSAMIYPTILLFVSLSVVVFLVVVVLPQFTQIFREIGASIPWCTQILLDISAFLKKYGVVAAMIPVGLWVLYRQLTATRQGRYQIDLWKLQIPVVGDLVKKALTARFTQTLSTLVSGGIPILTSLDVVTETVGNAAMARVFKESAVRVGEGKPLSQPLEESALFPDMVVNMIRVGEETGALDKMLEKISEFYNREVDNAIEEFTKLIEPILMVLMAGLIGFIAVSIFLPMADLMKNVQGV